MPLSSSKRKDMTMTVSHDEVMSRLSPERQARIKARTQELLEEESAGRESPFDGLALHAIEEYRQGRTTNIHDFAKELGVELADE